MNYRHAYHAGNFADVVKHAVQALIIEHLKRKDGGFLYLDTHAGIGAYDLASAQAEKTGEWRSGIGRLLAEDAPPAEILPYLDMVRGMNQGLAELRRYPGSPLLAHALARPQDRLALCELHPEDNATLKRRFGADPRVGVHHMDGYAALKALLPPAERRGLVLIDPPFEVKDEFERIRKGMAQAAKRWPTGLYAIWYPIKARAVIDRFHADLTMIGLPKTLAAEVMTRAGDDPATLNGCGLVIVNPPWKLDESLATLLPWLAKVLAPDQGFHRLEWIVEEKG
ncbi:MAG TPA: 23S rRNA (adenine(2030)-N(6))-methyltransferase RlmJ [Candidatus Omnitrophota bacterium]|nr:23S rRNA (adenine(2030)-N(6))-methyltransferase RlmJ [Candidatus Omnitrophota bacterium]